MEMKTKWLFIGGYIPLHLEELFFSSIKRNPPYAANSFQRSLIKGFDSVLTEPLDIINVVSLGSFPKNCSLAFVPRSVFSHSDGSHDVSLSFVNVSFLKQFLKPFGEKKAIDDWMTKNVSSQRIVFIYGCGNQYVRVSSYIKKKYPGVRIVLCIIDLPEFTCLSRKGFLRKALLRSKVKRFEKSKNNADFYVVISDFIPEKIGISKEKCLLVDSIVDSANTSFSPIVEDGRRKIVYAGSLTRKYGIIEMIDSFLKASLDGCDLYLYGDGETREEVIEISRKHKNVIYGGLLPQNQIQRILRSATFLINPRKPGQVFTKYSFPIKIAEYMLAGRPVVCYKLEAFSVEYDDLLIYANPLEENGLTDALLELNKKSVSELNAIGEKNFEYIMSKKSCESQAKRIVAFVEDEH